MSDHRFPERAWVQPIARCLGVAMSVAAAWAVPVAAGEAKALTFDDRVHAQAAIESVYAGHRTGASDAAVPRTVLEAKVRRYLAQSRALDDFWRRPITAAMLAREVERMAAESGMPRRLAELFATLKDDPVLVQECLARARLADRLVTEYAAGDERLQSWPYERSTAPLERLLEDYEASLRGTAIATVASSRFVLPAPGEAAGAAVGSCPAEEWQPLVATRPDERAGATAVWTGAEMIVWGGRPDYREYGDRYDPATNSWTRTSSTNAPPGRGGHTAVWTGTEMIVWGGRANTIGWSSTGGRYDPLTDTWSPIASANAPADRADHVAVWTGTEMIVWGGRASTVAEASAGGRYDPVADQWSTVDATNAPPATTAGTAVWAGDRMVVWGGRPVDTSAAVGLGGRYDPAADQWFPTSDVDAPNGRQSHTAVWSGDAMIVWGGRLLETDRAATDSGARYDPVTDQWTLTSMTDAPLARFAHSAVWTGSAMIVWGGTDTEFGLEPGFANGARYDPSADVWSTVSTTNAPTGRFHYPAVWTGDEMIVWGGKSERTALDTGGRYDPLSDSWVPTSVTATGAPLSRSLATGEEAVWTGSELFVWTGRGESGSYDPAAASWSAVSTDNDLEDRPWQNMVWTGTEVIVWNGPSGARYDPLQDDWQPISVDDAPGTSGATASSTWTGTEMIVWGGDLFEDPGTGGRYDPALDQWTATSTLGAPPSRRYHTAVWTGSEMIVWGGAGVTDSGNFPPPARYDPVLDRWSPISEVGAPVLREAHTAVWTGSEMIVWDGGYPGPTFGDPPSGGHYDPATDTWSPMSTEGAPDKRWFHTAVWTGDRMLVWGGGEFEWPNVYGPSYITGGIYDPATDRWEPTTLNAVPGARLWHVGFWTGNEMLVWGGRGADIHYRTGGRYAFLPDDDGDGFCGSRDCNDADPTIHAGAPELNDAQDNQCPGDLGFGAVDELAAESAWDGDRFGWTAQPGATSYEVARSSSPDFVGECTSWVTEDTFLDDPATPPAGSVWHYLARAVAENAGSWGLRSDGSERSVACAGDPATIVARNARR